MNELRFRAPGRANLIGEHTDYNEGFVLPVALELTTQLTGQRSDQIRLRSENEPGEVVLDPAAPQEPKTGWGRYVWGVASALIEQGFSPLGFEGTIASEVPVGAGLSSSASLELVVAMALSPAPIPPERLAEICHRAENGFVGVSSGIMDQTICAMASQGHSLMIDCRSRQVRHVPFPSDLEILVIDSAIQRGLASSAYNERTVECAEAAALLGLTSLRDATVEDVETGRPALGDVRYRRARHVVSENARVLETMDALASGDHERLGVLFGQSHRSLAADYEVSVPELDLLVDTAANTRGVVAARMTGAGFGGCIVTLAHVGTGAAAGRSVIAEYARQTGRDARSWVSRPAAGASLGG